MIKPILSIYQNELRRRKTYTTLWGIGIVVLSAFTVLAYGSIKGQAEQLDKAFASFSSTAGSFFGSSDMFTPVGYLNSQLFYITLPILFIILGVTLSSALIRKEESHHTIELLLARPVSRTGLLIAKIITADTIFAILGAAVFVTVIICSKIVGLDVPVSDIALATLIMTLFSGAFGAITFMFYAANQRTARAAAAITILLSLGGYIVTSTASLVHQITWLAKLFPYHYYNPGEILKGQVSTELIVYTSAMFAVALIVSIVGFRRRDLI